MCQIGDILADPMIAFSQHPYYRDHLDTEIIRLAGPRRVDERQCRSAAKV
jgi:hypothetical protein